VTSGRAAEHLAQAEIEELLEWLRRGVVRDLGEASREDLEGELDAWPRRARRLERLAYLIHFRRVGRHVHELESLACAVERKKRRLLRLLGAGGMGTVHDAVNTWTGRHVAVKELHGMVSSDATAVQRFTLEAQHASRIAHPNVSSDTLPVSRRIQAFHGVSEK
jgi:hypothetical protein